MLFGLSGWDLALLAGGGYLAVISLVRLMRLRRDQMLEQLRRDMMDEQLRRKRKGQPSDGSGQAAA
jgi:hypothetical protein